MAAPAYNRAMTARARSSSRQRGAAPRPRKALGQHFLRDTGVLADITAAIDPPEGALVVEIGAGTGQLTAYLLERGWEVVALEIEPRLVRHLRERFPADTFPGLRVIEADARDVDLRSILGRGARHVAVGNLPYFAASPIIRHLLEAPAPPIELVVMVQREVARELVAPPGDYSLLSIAVQIHADGERLFDVSPDAFDPPPAVWSTVVRLRPRPEPLVPRERSVAFWDLVARTFRNPRKQVHNAMGQAVSIPVEAQQRALAQAGIDPTRRPETLTIPDWLRLLDACEAEGRDG